MDKLNIKVSYVCTLPVSGNSPQVTINGIDNKRYRVLFIDGDTMDVVTNTTCENNETVFGGRQWFTNWVIKVFNEKGDIIFVDVFDPINKKVFIKLDAYALGDTLAWIPYVEEFRKKYNSTVICSTFHNYLIEEAYPDIMFIKPNTAISNIYYQVYIGAVTDDNLCYSKSSPNNNPLQKIASDALGLPFVEIKPLLSFGGHDINKVEGDYICISEFGSSDIKSWKYKDGWQQVVDFIKENGYNVVVISKEPTQLKNVINKTGDIHLFDRINDLKHAKLFIGVSSGLAWLSWAIGTGTMLISDVTPNYHEFQSDVIRIGGDLESIDYLRGMCTDVSVVIDSLKKELKIF